MSTPSSSPEAKARLYQLLTLAALSDIVIGVVLVFIGLAQDTEALTIAGAVVAAGGLGVGAWAMMQRGKPIQL
jgi:hypothetical protein